MSLSLVRTLSGAVQASTSVAAGHWTDAINTAGEIKSKVPTSWALKHRVMPWRDALLVCNDGHPIAFGPIIDEPEGDREFVTLTAGDLWSILDHRVVTNRDYPSAGKGRPEIIAEVMAMRPADKTDDDWRRAIDEYFGGEPADLLNGPAKDALNAWGATEAGNALAESTTSFYGLSLGTIAWRLVELAQNRPQGWLPVSLATPEQIGIHQRSYQGFNLGNNSVAKRLQEITEVIDGPDVAFRPRWVEDGHLVEWAMHTGTVGMPEIGQDRLFEIDLTAPKTNAAIKKLTAVAEPAGRVYSTGAGQDQGTIIRVENGPLPEGMPLIETVIADTQAENPDLLSARARGVIGQGRTVQVAVDVPISAFPLHEWWAGDAMHVTFPAGYTQLPAGTYVMRILSRSGSLASDMLTIEFQPEELV